MKGNILFIIVAMAYAGMLCSCKSNREAIEPQPPETDYPVSTLPLPPGAFKVPIDPKAYALPQATIFRMNGDYADKVAVTLNPDGTLAYFPAPTDLTASSQPLPLKDGWYLNRQGISANSVFTNWTFEQYGHLDKVPSTEEIIANIIPGAGVTNFITLPVKASEAAADPEICNKYITE